MGDSKASDPPETDLDYYSKPENYTGSSLQTMQRFVFVKEKENRLKSSDEVDERKNYEAILLERYKRLFPMDEEEERQNLMREQQKEQHLESIAECEEEIEPPPSSAPSVSPIKLTVADSGSLSPVIDIVSPSKATLPTEPGRKISDSTISVSSITSIKDESPTKFDGPRSSASGSLTPIEMKRSRSSVSSSTRASAIARAKQSNLTKEIRAQQARERWRITFKMVCLVKRLADAIIKKTDKKDGSLQTFTDFATDTAYTGNLEGSGLSFDPNHFKANKEITISSEVKHILSTQSDLRSPEQIQTAMFGLQSLKSFAEYPLHMQEKLCKVAWYEVVPSRRVIIRQGHYAENFYFILSGQAVVTIMLQNPKTGESFVKTATVMRKGMSFGELALLHRSRRTATVTSQDTVQLLTIGREDFFDIFMSGHGGIPDHIKFVSNIEFMKDWPIEQLLEYPQYCLLHFFKRNVVIVKDSRVSDWLYVVKSGSCQVLKQLRGVTPKLGMRRDTEIDEIFKLPKVGATLGPKIDTGIRRIKRSKPDNDEEKENIGNNSYSKDRYSQNPTTQKAHFVSARKKAQDNKFLIRKRYQAPKLKRPPTPVEKAPDPKQQQVFVQVELLKPRDVFGLERIQFDDDIERPATVVSLVSRGAECIMLNKDFFAKHANEEVKKRIRQQLRVYPEESTFQDNLQIKADWELFKVELIDDLTSS